MGSDNDSQAWPPAFKPEPASFEQVHEAQRPGGPHNTSGGPTETR